MPPITESGSRKLARALASKAMYLKRLTQTNKNNRELIKVYNSLCVVLDYLNEELKREPPIEGKAGPIPRTW